MPRISAHKKKGDLCSDFWCSATFKNDYGHQARAAKALLEQYSEDAILKAVSKDKTVYSYAAPFFKELCKEAQNEINVARILYEESRLTQPPPRLDTTLPLTRSVFVKKKSRWDALDGE
jgi:hypothetical protein